MFMNYILHILELTLYIYEHPSDGTQNV